MNQFSNGMSLLAVNSLEVHGIVHEINGKVKSIKKMSQVMEANTKQMSNDANEILRQLEEID